MTQKGGLGREAGPEGGGLGHSNEERPWVFSMIDCFLLIVNFFVITFKFKCDEPVLVEKMPAGIVKPNTSMIIDDKPPLYIRVSHSGEVATYELLNTRRVSLRELAGILESTQSTGIKVQVRVGYDRDVPWKDVIAVFNACTRAQITDCGLVPLKGLEPRT